MIGKIAGDDVHKRIDDKVLDRFWGKVNKDGRFVEHMDTQCWEWCGSLVTGGYGGFWVNPKQYRTHRLAWVLSGRDIPAHDNGVSGTLWICHKCDNRACVRPSHLYAGTPRQNSNDAIDRNRLPNDKPCPKCRRKITYISWFVHVKKCNGLNVCENCGSDDLYNTNLCHACYEYRRKNGKDRPPSSLAREDGTWVLPLIKQAIETGEILCEIINSTDFSECTLKEALRGKYKKYRPALQGLPTKKILRFLSLNRKTAFTMKEACQILNEYRQGGITISALANREAVDISTVSRLVNRHRWKGAEEWGELRQELLGIIPLIDDRLNKQQSPTQEPQ